MLSLRVVAGSTFLGLALVCGMAAGQEFPSKPVRLITAPPGGTADFTARFVAQSLAGLGQPAIVDNRGGGVIPGEFVAKAAPDGHTLLVHGSPLWLAQFLRSSVPYDVQKDFAAITFVAKSPNLLVVHPSLPVKSVKELIALAKARPGVLNHSMGSAGSSAHLAGELFKSMATVSMTGIPYKSDAMEIADLLSGQIDLTFGTAAFAMAHVKSGRLRALAVTSLQPSVLFPGLTTVAASGLPGYETGTVMGLFAPAGTRAAIINVLHQEVTRSLRATETKDRFLNVGVEIVGSSPEESAALVRSEMTKWGRVIRDAGIKAN